jgi:hypothetical protein
MGIEARLNNLEKHQPRRLSVLCDANTPCDANCEHWGKAECTRIEEVVVGADGAPAEPPPPRAHDERSPTERWVSNAAAHQIEDGIRMARSIGYRGDRD